MTDAPDPEESGSWLQRRGTDILVWVLVILATVSFAAGTAWLVSNARFDLREVSPPDALFDEAKPDESAPIPVPPVERPVEAPVAPGATGTGTFNPVWLVQPLPEFPARAIAARIPEGAVQLSCVAEVSGRLSQCLIVSETPAGHDFGANAVRATAADARVQPRQVEGVAVPSKISFTVRYRLSP